MPAGDQMHSPSFCTHSLHGATSFQPGRRSALPRLTVFLTSAQRPATTPTRSLLGWRGLASHLAPAGCAPTAVFAHDPFINLHSPAPQMPRNLSSGGSRGEGGEGGELAGFPARNARQTGAGRAVCQTSWRCGSTSRVSPRLNKRSASASKRTRRCTYTVHVIISDSRIKATTPGDVINLSTA